MAQVFLTPSFNLLAYLPLLFSVPAFGISQSFFVVVVVLKILFIHDRERESQRQREREAETQAAGEAGTMLGA